MQRTRLVPVASVSRATVAICLLMRVLASAQDVTEPELKAAFIYKFAIFTEWPTDLVPAVEPLVMCVLGDAAVSAALEQAAKGRMLAGHKIDVSEVVATDPHRVCHVLYVSGMTAAQASRVVAGLQDVSVLTISDLEGFTDLGGIAQFSFEHGRLRFSVHLESVKRARLQISSRLLALASIK
jgi:hypothetical protein